MSTTQKEIRGGWLKVNKANPCKICGKPDYCLQSKRSAACVCMRPQFCTDLSKPKLGGYLQWPAGVPKELADRRVENKPPEVTVNWRVPIARAIGRTTESAVAGLAETLGVSVGALRLLSVGYHGQEQGRDPLWGFPMYNGLHRPIGIRLREQYTGKKWAVTNSKNGVFAPTVLPPGPVVFVEGPTDTAACLTVGLASVGFASALCGLEHCPNYAKGRGAIVIADNDAVGAVGAGRLLELLTKANIPTRRISAAPFKDARQWLREGGMTAQEVLTKGAV